MLHTSWARGTRILRIEHRCISVCTRFWGLRVGGGVTRDSFWSTNKFPRCVTHLRSYLCSCGWSKTPGAPKSEMKGLEPNISLFSACLISVHQLRLAGFLFSNFPQDIGVTSRPDSHRSPFPNNTFGLPNHSWPLKCIRRTSHRTARGRTTRASRAGPSSQTSRSCFSSRHPDL